MVPNGVSEMNRIHRIAIVAALAVIVAVVLAYKNGGDRQPSPPPTAPPVSSEPTAAAAAAAPTASVAMPKLVCVGSGRCIPCKAMEPVRRALTQEYAGKLGVEFHDIGRERDALERFNVHVIPTSIFYDATGKEVDRFEGFIDKDDILARFAQAGVSF